jgi:hypothetical protein
LYGAETWTVRKVDQKYLGNYEMWYCRRIEKISRTNCVKNEEVLHRVNEERNLLHTIKRRKANWISHILRRNCLLKQITDGEIGGTGKRGRRKELRKQEDTGNWKEEAPDDTLWRTHFRRGYGPVTIHTAWQWYPWQLCQSL